MTDRNAELLALADELEREGGSRERSDRFLLVIGWTIDPVRCPGMHVTGFWHRPDGNLCRAQARPDPSQNLQDAINEVLRSISGLKWAYEVYVTAFGNAGAEISSARVPLGRFRAAVGANIPNNEAAALLAAICRAMAEER